MLFNAYHVLFKINGVECYKDIYVPTKENKEETVVGIAEKNGWELVAVIEQFDQVYISDIPKDAITL